MFNPGGHLNISTSEDRSDSSTNRCEKRGNDVNQTSTKHVDQHDDPLMYDCLLTRVYMKIFKDTLGVFLKQTINIGVENQSTKSNGAQLSELGRKFEKREKASFSYLIIIF